MIDFRQITSDGSLQEQLEALYGDVNNIDAWVGGLAEDHVRGGSVGPTFQRIIADQFERLRDGDYFWYQRIFTGADLVAIENVRLADVIKRNTTITNLQDNVFFFTAGTISGHVFFDLNRDGTRDAGELGLRGILVQILDGAGNVL
ncbi:MAG TPA: peroxidase family protein, partial [Gemmataceae bacterium]|nr:peroxidase family protein [Gemmataceae bacterium]